MRLVNRVLAALLSLALIVVGVLFIIEVAADRLNHRPAIVHWHSAFRWAGRTTWNAGSIRVAAVILIVLGLILLLAELKPARVSRLKTEPAGAGAADIDTAYTRRGVAAAVRSAVTHVDGVRGASVKVRRRKVAVAATSVFLDKDDARNLRESATTAAHECVTSLRLRGAASVSVRVTPRSH